MNKTKQQKQSRFAKNDFRKHVLNAAEIDIQDREYIENLPKEERDEILNKKQRSEEAYRQWEKESEDSSSTSGGIINSVKNTASAVANSAKNFTLSDIPDTFRMWTEGLYTMFKDEDLENIRNSSYKQDEIKMMARYKQLSQLKSDLEGKLNSLDDSNSQEGENVIQQLNSINEELSQYDNYFLTEGRNSDVVSQQMFDFDKLSASDIARLHGTYAFHNIEGSPLSDYINKPMQKIGRELKNIGSLVTGSIDYIASSLGGVVSHYMQGDGYSYDGYILGKALGYLDQNDPILKKAYKGDINKNSPKDPKNVANSIDSNAVGQYDQNNNYVPGKWYDSAERRKKEAEVDYQEHKDFLKDGKIKLFGSQTDGLDIVDFEDINPQFRKEHEQYGSSFSDIIAHPLHGLVETNSTVGMLAYQLPQMGAAGIAKLAARRIPAIAAISMASEPGLGLWGVRQSRQSETATEAIGAITERVVKEVTENGGDIQKITDQIVEQANFANIDMSDYVTSRVGQNGEQHFIPKDEKSLQEILKIGTAFNFSTNDRVFEQAKRDSRKGINKLINANNALAVYDYMQTLPFTSFWGSAMKRSAVDMTRKEVQRQLERNVVGETIGGKIANFVSGGRFTPAQQKLLAESNKEITSLVDKAIDKATKKYLSADIARSLKARDIAKYIKNKAKLIGYEGSIEGLEEVNQTMLSNRYGRGEYDDYNKPVSAFDLSEIYENVALSINGIGNLLGINTSDPDNADNELRKAFNIGFASSILFSGGSHALKNIYGADESNLSQLLIQLRDDSTIGKVVAEQQANTQDLVHLGMFYDAMKRGERSAQYMKERLDFLKKNIDKENSLVTDGFIDADKKLVDAMDLVLGNKNLAEVIDSYKQKFDKKANKQSGYDAKKRMYVNAAKAVADSNTIEDLVNKLKSDADNSFYELTSAIDQLFSGVEITDEQLADFEQQHPKLHGTIQQLLNDYAKYKSGVSKQYEEDKKAWIAENRKSSFVLDVDFSEEYDRSQIDKMEDELQDDEKFATDPFVSAIIRKEAVNSSPSARAVAAQKLMAAGNRRNTIERAYELKKNGFDSRDFVLDRIYALFLNEQKKAAEAVRQSIKNQAAKQQRVSELTGLDIDVSRIKGIENTIDEIVEGYTKRIDSLLGNDKREKKVSLDDVFGDQYQVDDEFISKEALQSLMLAQAMSKPAKIRKNAYLYGSQNPISIKDFLNSTVDEELAKTSKEYAKLIDDLRNGSLSDEVTAFHDSEKKLQQLTQKAAQDLILSEIKDQEKRRYIANKRKEQEPVTPNDVELAENGNVEAQEKINKQAADTSDPLVVSAGEIQARKKFNGGQKPTKSEKIKKIEELRERFKAASGTQESIAEEGSTDDGGLLETEEDVKEEFENSLAENAPVDDSEQQDSQKQTETTDGGIAQEENTESDAGDRNEDDFVGEDKNNSQDDHENDESPEDIPNDDLSVSEEEEPGELSLEEEEPVDISQEAQEKIMLEDESDVSQEAQEEIMSEDALDGLSIEQELGYDGEPILLNESGETVDTDLVGGQLEQLIDAENGTLDQNESSFDGTKRTVTEDTMGDMISDVLFYQPDPRDEDGNPTDETIKLSVGGKEVKLPKPLASGRQLAEKLLQKNWLNKTKKYWIVTQSLESQNTKDTERSRDTMTVCLILEDDTNCYAVTYRRLGESHSDKKDSKGQTIKTYVRDYEQELRNELYVKGVDWNKLKRLADRVGKTISKEEPQTAERRAKEAKPVFEAYAKEIARNMFVGDKDLGKGSDTMFDEWFKGLRPSMYTLGENDPKYLGDRQKRQQMLSDAYQMAKRQAMKGGRTPITNEQIDHQINALRKNRNEIIDAYLTLVEDTKGHKHFEFPKEVRTDVVPDNVTQSNGKINVNTIPGTNVHKFSNVMPDKSMEQIEKDVTSGNVVFGFGLGKFGSQEEAIQQMFTPVTDKILITTEDGRSIGVGKAGKIYMLVDSPNGTKVPIMLRESKFDRQYREENGTLTKVYLDDEKSWTGDERTSQFRECFEIDPNTGRPVLIKDNEGYKPSIAEILFYMLCGKFNTPNFTIDSEYFIHNGASTLIEGTDKFSKANEYLGPKQLYWGPIGEDGNPLQIENESHVLIPTSQYGLIIGMRDDDGIYRQHVFMHDELFSTSEESAQDRRSVIKAIATQMHWSMDAFLLTEKANIDSYEEGFGSFVKHVLAQNPGKEECSFYGCPDLTFKRSDFEDKESGDLKKGKQVQYFAWCIANNKLVTDLNQEKPFYAPFVFGKGVKNTPRKRANDAAKELGATDDKPAQLTQVVGATEEDVLLKNTEYQAEYWSNSMGVKRKPLFNKIIGYLKKGEAKKSLIDKLNDEAGAKEHEGIRDVVVFRLSNQKFDDGEQAINYLDDKIKEFVQKYNDAHKDQPEIKQIKYDKSDLNKVSGRLAGDYANRKAVPVMKIYGDGTVSIQTKPLSSNFSMPGFTGIYSTSRGKGKMNEEQSRKWLQEKLGLKKEQVIVTNAILRGTHNEEVFGLTNASADAMRRRIIGDAYVVLSAQSGIGVEYHEAWHFVNLLLHDKQTRRAIHNSYIKTHKKLAKPGVTYEDVEEAMAEDFRKWVIGQDDQSLTGKVKRAFSNFINFLLHTEDKKLYKSIYDDIRSGKYSGMPLDKESLEEFRNKYEGSGGVYSKVHGIPSVSDDVLENMPHIINQNDFFEALDGVINAISYELNLDSIEKIKAYSGRYFEEIIQIIKDLRDSQTDDTNVGILDDIINNPSLIKKALQDYLLSIGVNFKVKKIKQTVENSNGEKQTTEITVGTGDEEALEREDNPDNTWDKIELTSSHKDNAALRAKMFLKRVPMLRRTYTQDGGVVYEQVLDRFGTPKYWQYDEVWNLVMNELWSCDTLDAKDENTGKYLPNSIRGKVQKLATANAMFYALDQKFDEISDDIELRSQVFTTISASKNPVMIGIIQDAITKSTPSYDMSDSLSVDDYDERSMDDSGSVADRKRIFKFNNDSALQVAKSVPRTWSKNAALNGLVVYNAKTKKSTISSKFATSVSSKRDQLLKLIDKYKSQRQKKGVAAYTENDFVEALYGVNGIRDLFKQLCTEFGIPVDDDVIDAYVAMFNQNGEKLTPQQQINAFSEIMSSANGSLSKIIDDVVKSSNGDELISSDKRKREPDQLFNGYSENSNIGKLAVAYNYVHPQLSEYAVRDANGNLIYPINMPNELTDKTNLLNKNSDLAEDMSKSKLCEHSVILDASKAVDRNNPNTQLRLNTFAGLKDSNAGNGSDHAGLTALEDVLCKMFLTEMDHIVFPTMADKKTWQSLSSSNIKLSHELLLASPRKRDEMPFVLEAYKEVEEYDQSKYKDEYSYRRKAYDWYLSLPEDSEVKKNIREHGIEATRVNGQLPYKRFSDDTLIRFAKLFLDEINALIDYYDENHIAELVKNPNRLITNFHGNVSDGRMDFSGNGGKFRYFYDAYLSKDFAKLIGKEISSQTLGALDMNLNQKLNALYELQKKIESSEGVQTYTRNASNEKQIDPVFSKLTIEQAVGKSKEDCDGFELIRQFLKDLKGEVVRNGEFTQIVLDSINNKLIRMTEKSLQQFSTNGDVMQMIEVDSSTGLYIPTKIPFQLLKPYFDKLIQSKLIDEYSSVYSSDKDDDEKFAESQAVYSLIANFTINTALSVMEVEKVYTGEKAQYKHKKAKSLTTVRLLDYSIGDSLIDVTVDIESVEDPFSDLIKRLGGTQSPGNKLRSDFSDEELAFDPTLKGNKYTVCNVEDVEIPSVHLEAIFQNFKTQLVVDYLRHKRPEFFEKYVEQEISSRKEENKKRSEEGKTQKADLNRERILDRLYNKFELVEQLYQQIPQEDKDKIDSELASQVRPYTNITVADAQVFVRPALYRKMRIRLGEWTIEPDESGYSDEIAYNICESDDLWMKDPKKSMIVARFQINALKMSYFQNSPFNDAGMNINKAIYDKMALFPLFKMHRSTEFGRILYDRMNLKGSEIDQIAFKSAVKVGSAKEAPHIQKQIGGIEKFVLDKHGISKSKWKKLSQSEKLNYWIEYSRSQEFEEVKNALKNINDKFEVIREGDKVSAKYDNQYSVDYTNDGIRTNENQNALPISVQDLRNIRLQLNTRAHEADVRAIGTQMFKLAFSNIIDNAEYGTGKSGRQSRLGSEVKADIIRCILRLTNIGIDEIRQEFYNSTDGKLNKKAVRDYVKRIAINNGLGESAQELLAEGAVAAALMSRYVFEHGVSSYVNKKVVDINTKGGTAIQQSVVGFVGYGDEQVSTYYDQLYQKYNDGEELNWNAKEGSMEVLLSMNFFKPVIPKNVWALGYAERRQWLIDNDIIKGTKTDGSKSDPKPFGVGYRIPTQGMSSMFSYIVADVLPEQVGDLIVVPREFTAQTGSDYDVDKLFLANYSYKTTDSESYREVENRNSDDTAGAIGNTLLDNYIDIISDRRNFANARASIDVITNTIQSELLPVLRDSQSGYIEGMDELLPYFQTLKKLEFGTGKAGIGPFALNVTNLALTQYMHLTMTFGTEGVDFGLGSLDEIEGEDGRRISDWLSAMVNAHVDVAKDAYVRDINVNQFTYNHANLLLRCGKGITTFSFLAQPILKTLSDYMNNSGGIYGDNFDGSNPTQASKSKRKNIFKRRLYEEYKAKLEIYLDSDKLSEKENNDIRTTIAWIDNELTWDESKKSKEPIELPIAPADMFNKEKALNVISILRNSSNPKELVMAYMYQIQVLNSFERLDKYAQSLSELVQCSQIDTKKFGNTIAAQRNFVNKLNTFLATSDLWVINDPDFINSVPLRKKNKKPLKKDVSYMALKKYFESMYLEKKLNSAVNYTKGILEHQLFTATDAYDNIFTTICSIMFGSSTVQTVDGKEYNLYGLIYKDETLQTIANAIDDIIRYNVFVNQGPQSITKLHESGNDLAIDLIGTGSDYIRENMKRLLFGNDKEQPLFNRVAKLIKDIKKNPYDENRGFFELINENGEIANQFLLYLSPQTANQNYPIGRMLLSTSQMNVSTYTKRQLMAGFDQLLSSSDDEIRKLAEDLVFYAYFSTYDQNTVNSFFDLVPPDYRKQYDAALKYALKNNHKISVLQAITGVIVQDPEMDRESVERSMISSACNTVIDVLSRNFWYDDNIVQRFFTKYQDNNNKFTKKYGDVIPVGVFDAESQRSFQPWIATTRTDSMYIKIKKGKTTMLYKKVGVVNKTEKGKENPKNTTFNVYAVVQKAGLHRGNINQFEFYCDANTPSIFGDNQIMDTAFALDRVESDINDELKDLKNDKDYEYSFELLDGPEIDPMYVSTNSETYYQSPIAKTVQHSNQESTMYAKIEKSSGSADRRGLENADYIINLVTEDKGPEVNRSVSKPLQEAENISDATVESNTQNIVDNIVKLNKQDITIYVTSTFAAGLQSNNEELAELKRKKKEQYISENKDLENVEELAEKYVESLSDYTLDDELLEGKISRFLDKLIYDLNIAGVKVKCLSAPLGKNRKPVAFSVIAAHKTHNGFFTDSKAIIYPVDKFVNDRPKQFRKFLMRVQNMLDESPVTEDVVDIQENAETAVKQAEKKSKDTAKQAKKKFSNFASAVSMSDESVVDTENVEQSDLTSTEVEMSSSATKQDENSKKNRFASAMTDDILLESSEESSIDHENC